MNRKDLLELLREVAAGEKTPEKALERLLHLPYEDLGFARLDHHRALRKHFPEVIYGPGKTLEQLEKIIEAFREKGEPLLVTRVEEKKAQKLLAIFSDLNYYPRARLIGLLPKENPQRGLIILVSAGTADEPVAEEALICAQYFGNRVEAIRDVGVAGIHRLFPEIDRLNKARAIIVVAGMEGALPSLVAGLVDRPVIAVPTSIGYGANFSGLAPLLAMLNSCAPGVAVVNIDNGFGAAYLASLINQIGEESGTNS